jgi:hypothetical protein
MSEQQGRGAVSANCMAHCGYEPSAVLATMGHGESRSARCAESR